MGPKNKVGPENKDVPSNEVGPPIDIYVYVYMLYTHIEILPVAYYILTINCLQLSSAP